MISQFKALYRVNKANYEAKKKSPSTLEKINDDQISKLNSLVKRLFESSKAYVIVNENSEGSYNIEFHSGIKGPINFFYFSRRFSGITHYLDSLKYVLTTPYKEMKVVTAIRDSCRHFEASKIDIKLIKSNDGYESYFGVIYNLPLSLIYNSKYHSDDIMKVMNLAPEDDIFTHMHFALLKFGDSYFSINNIIFYLLSTLTNKENHYAVDSGVTEADKIQQSMKIRDKLVHHKVISAQDRYQIKKAGIHPGIILQTKDKDLDEHRIFIKKLNNKKAMGLHEMMVFHIAQECGCVVPNIQVFLSSSEWCMLSKDISCDSKKLTYLDLYKIIFSSNMYLDTKNYCIYSDRQENEAFNKTAYIDKLSVARVILMSILFNLSDINFGNIGFRFRQLNEKTIAELTLLDFNFNDYHVYTKKSTLNEMISLFARCNNFDTSFRGEQFLKINTLEELCKQLTTQDYVDAFQSIKDNFESAYKISTVHSKKILREHFQNQFSYGMLFKTSGQELMSLWLTNFKLLSKILHHEHQPEELCHPRSLVYES